MGAENKVRGLDADKKHPKSSMKDERYIPPFPLRFVQGDIYIHLLLIKECQIW
jgi:hypothetical protein